MTNCGCGTGVLKQGNNAYLPIEFEGLDLDTVESIDFVFKQFDVEWELTYPSDIATRRADSTNVVEIKWLADDTWRFEKNQDVYMDTRVHLTGSWQNPKTPIVSFRIDKTLFRKDEEDGDGDGNS